MASLPYDDLIDIHTHIGTLPGAVGDRYDSADLVYVCEHEGVSFALASSASTTTISRQTGTRETLDMVAANAGGLGGMLWVNPHDPDWRDDLTLAKDAGFYAIKIHPCLDHYAVDRAALDDVFAAAAKNHWPILTHTDVDGTEMSGSRYVALIEAWPAVPLILAHLRIESIPLAKRYDNVFVDTTYVAPERVELGVDALGPSKILYGSDACEGFDVGRTPGRVRPPRSHAAIVSALRARGIRDAALDQILARNARDLFGLQH